MLFFFAGYEIDSDQWADSKLEPAGGRAVARGYYSICTHNRI